MGLVKTNAPGYLLEPDKNIVINTNDKELQSYRSQVLQSKEITSLKDRLEAIEKLMNSYLLKG